ncbi:MAG: sugar ABC transporter ATP-binding protein [Planctomycetaceae bacterium]|nr:sugar ABC transporter ATP-binding protein [Planctomycetaceae bacterium]
MPMNSTADDSVLLRMQGITKHFGPTVALADVSLQIRRGRVLALIGENGAGKSTLMKILSGATAPDSGNILFEGQAYHPRDPHAARLAGVSMIYQELTIAPDLSIEDNILLGCESSRWGLLDRTAQRQRMREAISLLGLTGYPLHWPARKVSPGVQQLIEIARALVIDSRVVIFDEPTSSLTAADAARLFEVIRLLKLRGLGIAYISHFLEEIRGLCDDYLVLRDGRSVGSGELTDTSDAQIVRLMIGREVADLFPTVPHHAGDVLLDVSLLTSRTHPAGISLQLRRGEIVGLAGLIGSGRTEFLRCLYGLDPIRSGAVRVGRLQPAPRPAARIRSGMGMVSEDRKSEGLAQGLSVMDNLTLSRLSPYSCWGWLNPRRRLVATQAAMEQLQVKARHPRQAVSELSGGNQQKVALARVLHQQADLLLLDEPTRGIDVGTKAEIYRLMGSAAAEGKAVLFISSYLPELMAVCDRIGVMSRGRLLDVRPAREWTEEAIMQLAVKS